MYDQLNLKLWLLFLWAIEQILPFRLKCEEVNLESRQLYHRSRKETKLPLPPSLSHALHSYIDEIQSETCAFAQCFVSHQEQFLLKEGSIFDELLWCDTSNLVFQLTCLWLEVLGFFFPKQFFYLTLPAMSLWLRESHCSGIEWMKYCSLH